MKKKDKEKKNNKKLIVVIAIILLLSAVGFTLAYFVGQIGSGATANINVTTATVDTLTFSTGADISIGPVTQQNFASGQPNQTGSTTASAMLRANNTTNTANETYNLYVNITNNTFKKTTENAELILTITDPTNTAVTSLSGLTYTTVKGVSGFDVTEKSGLITIANDYTISVANQANNPKTDTWNITLTFVNLDADQSANAGATFQAQAIIQKEAYAEPAFTGTIYRFNTESIKNGDSIVAVKNYAYVITDGTSDFGPYNDQTSCESALTGFGSPQGYYCNEQEVTTGLTSYETNVANISNDYYLKHEVTNNIIQNSQVCLNYNNRTFCMGPNFWVSGDSDGTQTKAKLQSAMETALGTSANSCDTYSDSNSVAHCRFGSNGCFAISDGSVYCFNGSIGCNINTDSKSFCNV